MTDPREDVRTQYAHLSPHYPIRTARLALRPLTLADLDDAYAYKSHPDVCRYAPYEPRTREQVAEFLESDRNRSTLTEPGQKMTLAVEDTGTGHVVGDLMLAWTSGVHRTGEIGYILNADVHGRGYATEACRALLKLGFNGLGLRRLTARIDARNASSIAVARRLGMRQEAHLVQNQWFKGEWTDEVDFALLHTEFMTASSQP